MTMIWSFISWNYIPFTFVPWQTIEMCICAAWTTTTIFHLFFEVIQLNLQHHLQWMWMWIWPSNVKFTLVHAEQKGGWRRPNASNWISFNYRIGNIYICSNVRKCVTFICINKIETLSMCTLFAWGANATVELRFLCLHFTQLVYNVYWTDYIHCAETKSNAICIIAFHTKWAQLAHTHTV